MHSDFEQIKKLAEDGQEYWTSRELCNALVALPMLAKATWGIRLPHLQKVGQWASPIEKEKNK